MSVFTLAGRLYLALLRYNFLFARPRARVALLLPALLPRLLRPLPAFFTARRTPGFAAPTFFVNAFWTAPALPAIVPCIHPIDSATLARIASSFHGL